MYLMEHRCAGKLSGGFGGPFMYVLSPTSTKPKYRLIKMEKKKKKKTFYLLFLDDHMVQGISKSQRCGKVYFPLFW